MNVERLHLILKATLDAVTAAGLVGWAHRPSQGRSMTRRRLPTSSRSALNSKSSAPVSRRWRPISSPWLKQILREHGLSHFIGDQLLQVLVEIFSRNAITPSVALKELQAIQTELAGDVAAVTELLNGFKRLNFRWMS